MMLKQNTACLDFLRIDPVILTPLEHKTTRNHELNVSTFVDINGSPLCMILNITLYSKPEHRVFYQPQIHEHVNNRYFLILRLESRMVNRLMSWKHSFNRLNEEHQMAEKKKQAINNLLNSGKISKATYELFEREITEAIAEVEKQQQALLAKMKTKAEELEGEIGTLEMLLANFEIEHVTGEMDEEAYQRESIVLSVGLETARQELAIVRGTVIQLLGNEQNTIVINEQPTENVEISRSEVTVVEAQPPQTQKPNEPPQSPVEPLPAEVKTEN